MEIRYEVLARNKFEYEINRDEFNRLMNAKKSAQRYDRFGRKKMEFSKTTGAKINIPKNLKPERIRSEYIKGPFALVFVSTPPDKSGVDEIGEKEGSDHYIKQAVMVFSEGENLRVYRDSLNDGFTNARFCDDTIMLMMLVDRNNPEADKRYFKVEGEPTSLESYIFEHSNENQKELMESIVKKYHEEEAKKLGMDKDKVFVIIQLEDTENRA